MKKDQTDITVLSERWQTKGQVRNMSMRRHWIPLVFCICELVPCVCCHQAPNGPDSPPTTG